MKFVIFLILFSLSALGNEIKIQFNREEVLIGETVQGSVAGYYGQPIDNKRVGDELYIVSMDSEAAEIIFLKKLSSSSLKLDEENTIVWSPIELKEVSMPQGISLIEQSLNFGANRTWIIILTALAIISGILAKFYLSHYRPKLIERKRKTEVKNKLFSASSFEEVTEVWRQKHQLIQMFPNIEEAFVRFEVDYYKIAFRPDISEEDKKSIEKKYQNFLDQVRGVNFGI